jgi:glycosyltransferase involved in cell wall biosynthesis
MRRPTPRVTVLMPAFDASRYLRQAVDSVLAQTFDDFELLAIDDGSGDDTASILAEYVAQDPRVRLIRNGRNLGLIATLNRGLDRSRGELVARFDADDLCLPQRLERQVAWMDDHPDIDLGAPWVEMFNENGSEIWKTTATHDEIVAQCLFLCPLLHPSVVFRRERFVEHGIVYPAEFPHIEDYALWVLASPVLRYGGQPEVLVRMRFHGESVSSVHGEVQLGSQLRVQVEALRNLGIRPTDEEVELHRMVSQRGTYPARAYDRRTVVAIGRWLHHVLDAGVASHAIERSVLAQELARQFLQVCKIAARGDGSAVVAYLRWARRARARVPRRALAALIARSLTPPFVRVAARGLDWRAERRGPYRSPR